MMTKEQCTELMERIGWDGFDYTFADYSNWKNIKDETFQLLRTQFVESRRKLREYIDVCSETYDLDSDDFEV